MKLNEAALEAQALRFAWVRWALGRTGIPRRLLPSACIHRAPRLLASTTHNVHVVFHLFSSPLMRVGIHAFLSKFFGVSGIPILSLYFGFLAGSGFYEVAEAVCLAVFSFLFVAGLSSVVYLISFFHQICEKILPIPSVELTTSRSKYKAYSVQTGLTEVREAYGSLVQ
ncbi:hypothetical protein EDB83DRAFT_737748 [Lactarius deliciosus]|nr:hypothetical protein EDB83DRAFT_737748 [Lactarius deliciosus]